MFIWISKQFLLLFLKTQLSLCVCKTFLNINFSQSDIFTDENKFSNGDIFKANLNDADGVNRKSALIGQTGGVGGGGEVSVIK
jgi:hypothetical protein